MNPAEMVDSYPLKDWAWLVKTSICSVQRIGPPSDFNQNTDGQKKSPDSNAPFIRVSELKERSHRKQDCDVYRGDTDNCRAGGASLFVPVLRGSRGSQRKHSVPGKGRASHFVYKHRWCL